MRACVDCGCRGMVWEIVQQQNTDRGTMMSSSPRIICTWKWTDLTLELMRGFLFIYSSAVVEVLLIQNSMEHRNTVGGYEKYCGGYVQVDIKDT